MALRHWLGATGPWPLDLRRRTGQVPPELWRELAEAAVRVAAAAQLLAGGAEDDGAD